MYIYLIKANVDVLRYDTYDSAVVIAESATAAQLTSPNEFYTWINGQWHFVYRDGTTEPTSRSDWPNKPLDSGVVDVHLVGTALPGSEPGVVCASFNAG